MVAGVAGIAALAAQAVAPASVAAGNGDPVKLGQTNSGTASTWVSSTANPALGSKTTAGDGMVGESAGGGSGVYGHGTTGTAFGVFGRNDPTGNTGFLAGAQHAVMGTCTVDGFAGVSGKTTKKTGVGVMGQNAQTNTVGVLGSTAALGGLALGEGTYALQVVGHAAFSGSGVVTVPAGKRSTKISGIALRAGCFVLATLQQYRAGVAVAAAVPSVSGKSITIYMTKAVASATKVAWFVLDVVP